MCTDRPAMTIAVDFGVKRQNKQTNKQTIKYCAHPKGLFDDYPGTREIYPKLDSVVPLHSSEQMSNTAHKVDNCQ